MCHVVKVSRCIFYFEIFVTSSINFYKNIFASAFKAFHTCPQREAKFLNTLLKLTFRRKWMKLGGITLEIRISLMTLSILIKYITTRVSVDRLLTCHFLASFVQKSPQTLFLTPFPWKFCSFMEKRKAAFNFLS